MMPLVSREATEILKKQQLNIRDARISTNEDSRACHFYVVQDKISGSGLSEDRLAQADLVPNTMLCRVVDDLDLNFWVFRWWFNVCSMFCLVFGEKLGHSSYHKCLLG
jgi:hypothetical protein